MTDPFRTYIKESILRARRADRRRNESRFPDAVYGMAVNGLKHGFALSRPQWYGKSKKGESCRRLHVPEGVSPLECIDRGRERLIVQHNAADTVVLSAVSRYLIETFNASFSPHSHGNRTKRKNAKTYNHRSAIGKFREYAYGGYPYAVKLDITDFYGSIPHEGLLDTLRSSGSDPDLVAFIESYLRLVAESLHVSKCKFRSKVSTDSGLKFPAFRR